MLIHMNKRDLERMILWYQSFAKQEEMKEEDIIVYKKIQRKLEIVSKMES